MTEMVGVHGVSLRRLSRGELERAWLRHLDDGLQLASGRAVAAPSFSVAFFDDLVMPEPASGAPPGKGPDLSGSVSALDADELSDFEAAVMEVLSADEIAQAAARPPDKAYTRVPGPLGTLMAALDRRFGAAAVVLLIWEFKQVRRYLVDPAIKAAVDKRIRDDIAADCTILFAHSLGTVVAFEFLRQNPGHHVDLFLTAGSPLGLRMVRDRMADAGYGSEAAWGIPGNVAHWVNLRDPHDPVACAGDLGTWWPGVIDRRVRNGGDAHSAERYLSQREGGLAILAALPGLSR